MADWTFATLIADEMTVTAHCQNSRCNHSHRLDLKDLAARLGPDTPAMQRRPRSASEVHEMRREEDRPRLHPGRAAGRQPVSQGQGRTVMAAMVRQVFERGVQCAPARAAAASFLEPEKINCYCRQR
jgi:hypothetical protein